jgi:predicted 3-demethylubiquinone-9 3-methyltransferase (glyoxalase superfamily)
LEAAEFYKSVFEDSMIKHKSKIFDTPSGDCDIVGFSVMVTDFNLEGQWFAPMYSALEHQFTFNESISFMGNCKDQNETSMIVK